MNQQGHRISRPFAKDREVFSDQLPCMSCCRLAHATVDLLSALLKARELLEKGVFDMGRTYRKIVSKLLEWAFGNIVDLDDPRHKAAFLESVINPLEEEEQKLTTFLGSDRA